MMPSHDGEVQARIDARIASAQACLMNNTKWRELFSVLGHSTHLKGPLRWHFVDVDRVFTEPAPSTTRFFEDRLPDVLPSPCSPYREIDWIEIPKEGNDLELLALELKKLGQLPLSRSESGLRISGYVW